MLKKKKCIPTFTRNCNVVHRTNGNEYIDVVCFKGLLAQREEVQKFNYCVHPSAAMLLPSAISLKGDFKSSAAPLV